MSENINLVDIDKILPKIADALFDIHDLAKLLKFDTSDALSKNITQTEVDALFNQDEGNLDCRIFYQPFNDKNLSEKRAELRIYFPSINPLNNNILADINIGFDVVVHNQMWKLDDSIVRPLRIVKLLVNKLNGLNLGNAYDLILQDRCRLILFNDNFSGYSFIMKTKSR